MLNSFFRLNQYIYVCVYIYMYIYICIYISVSARWTMAGGNLLVKTFELTTRFARRLLQGSILCIVVIMIFLLIIILFDVIF